MTLYSLAFYAFAWVWQISGSVMFLCYLFVH